MIFIELAIGIAAVLVIFALIAVSLQILFWLLVFMAVLAGIGFLIVKFPLEILIAILIIEGAVLMVVLLFKALIGLGCSIRLKLSEGSPPNENRQP